MNDHLVTTDTKKRKKRLKPPRMKRKDHLAIRSGHFACKNFLAYLIGEFENVQLIATAKLLKGITRNKGLDPS